MPFDEHCYNDKSECPKCNNDIASTEYIKYLPDGKEVILRQCQVCSHVRVELPLDDPACVNGP